jgi:hypothetical protein
MAAGEAAAGVTQEAEVAGEAQLAAAVARLEAVAEGPAVEQAAAAELEELGAAGLRRVPCTTVLTISRDS